MRTPALDRKRAKPAPLADEKAPRPRNVLLAEFEGLAKADASQALRDAGGDLSGEAIYDFFGAQRETTPGFQYQNN